MPAQTKNGISKATKQRLLREVENLADLRTSVQKRVLRAIVNKAANSIITNP